jgi:hypothetical protein
VNITIHSLPIPSEKLNLPHANANPLKQHAVATIHIHAYIYINIYILSSVK